MRKDAKIGFAIGGVLLAVLTVYAIVVPKHKKSSNTVSLVTQPQPAVETTSQSPVMIANSETAGAAAATPVPTQSSSLTSTPPALVHNADPTAVAGNDNGAVAIPLASGPKPDEPKLDKPGDLVVDRGGVVTPDFVEPTKVGTAPVKTGKVKNLKLEVPENSATPAGSDHIYVVQAGQTLSSIANEIYGNPRFWVAIQRENKSINSNHLKIGEKIKLPDISPVQPGAVEEPVSAVAVLPPDSVAPPVVTDAHSYVVKAGDSLYKIARTVLGSGRRAEALYALNKDLIGPDKARLKLGMVLKLPESSTLASSHEVR